MTKHIGTLVEDIRQVLQTKGGWDEAITDFFSTEFRQLLVRRFESEESGPRNTLRLSNMGVPCHRKLWYTVNDDTEREALPASARLKFLYGDILEILLIALAKAAGHNVQGEQSELEIAGIKGHRDCVIDGVVVDVKSASPRAFDKFKSGNLRDDDPFGYISQLSSYVFASRDGDVPTHPSLGAFLVVDKVSGDLVLDMYDFSAEMDTKVEVFEETKRVINNKNVVPDRGFRDVEDGYKNPKTKAFVPNGNRKLGLNCSYCEFKHKCWPSLRTYLYKGPGGAPKPVFLTRVTKEPKVMEVSNA